MKTRIKIITAIPLILIVLLGVFYITIRTMNQYSVEGELKMPSLQEKVTIHRDNKGMAYIHGKTFLDGIRAFGFVSAQDRLTQMVLLRLVATGRVSELAGEKGLASDRFIRTLGFPLLAKKQALLLDDHNRKFIQAYADGVNDFLKYHKNDLPLELRAASLEVEPWTVEDTIAIAFYMSWHTAANIQHELLSAMIIDAVGEKRFREIEPLNINPDESRGRSVQRYKTPVTGASRLIDDALVKNILHQPEGLGSNNWAASAIRTSTGNGLLAGDPHLKTTMLPGPLYAVGIVTPETRVTGAGIPGTPLLITLRNSHVAMSVTNSYGDSQDCYFETIDPSNPGNYMEGRRSIPFMTRTEVLKVKDKGAKDGYRIERLVVRSTKRGPVISSVVPGLMSNRVISVRWAVAESMDGRLALDSFMTAGSVKDIQKAVREIGIVYLNFVAADDTGSILWQTSGNIPRRRNNTGELPIEAGPVDNWYGWVSPKDMPHSGNPARGWVGTCNHKTVSFRQPWYYSSYFSSSFRYARLKKLMETDKKITPEMFWKFQRDAHNVMAEKAVPVLSTILLKYKDTKNYGDILKRWNFVDDKGKTAPALYHLLIREMAIMTFQDELGTDITRALLKNQYFWKERFLQMILQGNSSWFDKRNSASQENLPMIVHSSAQKVMTWIRDNLGKSYNLVKWGDIHTMEYYHALARKGILKRIAGTGPIAMDGSCETLYRARYRYEKDFTVEYSSGARMVADLSNKEYTAAVLSSGITGRLFHPHNIDQVEAYHSGDQLFWWFSDEMIKKHARSTYQLVP